MGCKGRGWNFPFRPLEEVLKKIKGNGKALGKKGEGGKTDTNKARDEIVAFCPGERKGAGRFRAETGQDDLTAPELSKLHTLH